MDGNNYTRQDQEEDEEEETLSLSDLPLTADDVDEQPGGENHSKLSDRRSSSEPTAFFEFFSDLNSDQMSHAEDIIFCGKLRPLNEQPQTHKLLLTHDNDEKTQSLHSRRCGSMSELRTTRPDSPKTRVMRSSRSLDYQKLRRTSSSSSLISDPHRSSFNKRSAKCDGSGQKGSKPRWYVLMFGFVKFPPEMHLRDIRNRQVRRNPAGLFPSFEAGGGGKVPISQSDRRKSSWGLLRVLSCKGHASVAVTASFGCMTQI